ncbi:IucA/IucC family protein [Micromonospora sp. CPCC 206061]|uniref:IucA/IucC family protein n=1 Tax=Micromonospora sp. CPCC 206061 TaxID=3122410 RepID=UPI002FF33A34
MSGSIHDSSPPRAGALHRFTPDPDSTLAALRDDRPGLVAPYLAALPGARAAVLGRLWGALAREPIPGVTGREVHGGRLTVTVAGHRLTGPADAAEPYAPAPDGLTVGGYTDPAALVRGVLHQERFAVEVDNSVANLALARANASPASTSDLASTEQSVVDGHPLHPCCRTRLGMSTAEVLAYAPEHRPVVHLRLVDVPPDRWHGDAPPRLVVHPWQYAHVLDAYPWLTPAGTLPARPLMSLRTLAVPGYHLKTAVDVQMTSAVRTVSPAAVHNGPVVSALLAHLAHGTGLEVLREDRAGAVLVDGAPSRSLAYVRRLAPALAPGETAVPLAGLGGAPDAADPEKFFAALARVFLPPLLTLLARGAALEAHGQNTLIVLRDGRPARLLYRDVGGVRISPARLRAHGVDPPPVRGDLVTDNPDQLRDKLFAAALSGVVAEQVAAFGRVHGIAPERLWARVAAVTNDQSIFRASLPVKATTAMRLAADPLTDVWASLPNPLAGMR